MNTTKKEQEILEKIAEAKKDLNNAERSLYDALQMNLDSDSLNELGVIRIHDSIALISEAKYKL